jgi:hypothetical protein
MGSKSKSSSSSSQTTNNVQTTKDNSAIVEDGGVNVADSSGVTVSILDGNAINRAFDYSNNVTREGFDTVENIADRSLLNSEMLTREAFDFGELLANESFGFANDTVRSSFDYLDRARIDDLNILNSGIEANRQLTDKVVSTIAEQSEPEITDLSKYVTGAVVIVTLGSAFILSRKK